MFSKFATSLLRRHNSSEMQAVTRWAFRLNDSKHPVLPNGYPGKINDPSTWYLFEDCIRACPEDSRFVGFHFATGGGFGGFDFNAAMGPDIAVDNRVRKIVKDLKAHTKFNPSGHGVRVFCRVPPGTANINESSCRFEFYTSN